MSNDYHDHKNGGLNKPVLKILQVVTRAFTKYWTLNYQFKEMQFEQNSI